MKSTESFLSDISDRPLPILDHDGLLEALWAADSPTLLMVLTHLTGDEDFLQRFVPYLYSPMCGPNKVPTELDRELRDRLFARLTLPEAAPERLMSHQLFMRMASISVGEPISEEFMPLLIEQMGFVKQSVRSQKIGRPLPAQNSNVFVIGAGLNGVLADVVGCADFKGEPMQAAGCKPDVDIGGKSMALIGAAGHSEQLRPVITEIKHLTVYQRPKHWVVNNPYSTAKVGISVKWALQHIPYFSEWFRFRTYWIASEGFHRRSRVADQDVSRKPFFDSVR